MREKFIMEEYQSEYWELKTANVDLKQENQKLRTAIEDVKKQQQQFVTLALS
jgi:FtsZ-binding cell division protein ZapB